MWASNPSPGPAHRPLGTRPTAITTLSSGPAARVGVLQTGGRDPTGRGVVNEKVGPSWGGVALEEAGLGRVQGDERICKPLSWGESVVSEEARKGQRKTYFEKLGAAEGAETEKKNKQTKKPWTNQDRLRSGRV